MQKLVMLNRLSLDGFYAGANGEIDWFIHDHEVDKVAHEWIEADTLLLGRRTYQEFESFWPHVARDPKASKDILATAKEINQMNKVVFSRTLKEVTWENSELFQDNLISEVRKLKERSGGIIIFGSGSLVQQLGNADLIDEYLIIQSPVVIGKGKALFQDVKGIRFELVDSQKFSSGNVLNRYKA